MECDNHVDSAKTPEIEPRAGVSAEAKSALLRLTSDLSSGFPCLLCPMMFRQLFSLVQHQQRHFIEDKLIRKYANKREPPPRAVPAEEIEEVANSSAGGHLTEESTKEIRPHRCPHCSKTYSFGYYLENHIKKCRPKRDAKQPAFCEVCGLQLGSRTSLVRHQIEQHGMSSTLDANEGGVPCEYCERKFEDSLALEAHIASDHVGDNPFKCGTCEASFSLKVQLDEHNLKEHDAGVLCVYCGKIFKKQQSLDMHVKEVHLIDFGSVKNVVCPSCDKRFTHERFLKSHVMSKHREKTHHCQHCGKAFSELPHLKRHEKIHVKEKPFKCRFCQKGFLLKRNRENHEMTHTGEKPLSCQHCGKGFIQKTNLKKHEQSHEFNLSNQTQYNGHIM